MEPVPPCNAEPTQRCGRQCAVKSYLEANWLTTTCRSANGMSASTLKELLAKVCILNSLIAIIYLSKFILMLGDFGTGISIICTLLKDFDSLGAFMLRVPLKTFFCRRNFTNRAYPNSLQCTDEFCLALCG